ncbi:MAG: precorrin-6y C5,15-methyltransferase (decarboxylating) subunit CbiE [Oscillospiraceae bacterium]|nr:precorrin-6y C5,15-methyltransferase (decarboxylating) subunit CbiE [Oscillospiraceae bacterium]
MDVYIVGCGMEGGRTLTAEGRMCIDRAELLIGSERISRAFPDRDVIKEYSTERIADIINGSGCSECAVLMSGDTSFFSGARALYGRLCDAGHRTRLIPGISSMAYLGAAAGINTDDADVFSLHGAQDMRGAALRLFMTGKVFYLFGGKNTPAALCRHLSEYGMRDAQVIAGSELGYENERIWRGTAADCTEEDGLSVMLAMYERNADIHFIRDDMFGRAEHIPMTKAEVRSLAADMLNIRETDICWDIGCGTGSVSVQMAYKCPKGAVYAYDKREIAVETTLANARRFSCDNIIAAAGECPDICEGSPLPDKVFIGGSGGRLADTIGYIYGVREDADILVSAATVDTLTAAVDTFGKYRGCDVVQLHIDRTKDIAGLRMFEPLTPVYLIKGRR